MKVESIAECSHWSLLQYFQPALSDNWSWKPIFGHFRFGRFTQFYYILKSKQTEIQQQVRFVHVQDCIAIIGLENQFLVSLRVAVLDRFFTFKKTNPSISMTKNFLFCVCPCRSDFRKWARFMKQIIELYHGYHVCRVSEKNMMYKSWTWLF